MLEQRDIYTILKKMEDPLPIKFKWIKTRLTRVWKQWVEAQESLRKTKTLTDYPRKKVNCLHISAVDLYGAAQSSYLDSLSKLRYFLAFFVLLEIKELGWISSGTLTVFGDLYGLIGPPVL